MVPVALCCRQGASAHSAGVAANIHHADTGTTILPCNVDALLLIVPGKWIRRQFRCGCEISGMSRGSSAGQRKSGDGVVGANTTRSARRFKAVAVKASKVVATPHASWFVNSIYPASAASGKLCQVSNQKLKVHHFLLNHRPLVSAQGSAAVRWCHYEQPVHGVAMCVPIVLASRASGNAIRNTGGKQSALNKVGSWMSTSVRDTVPTRHTHVN